MVQGRKKLIAEQNREELEKYICGIIKNNNSKPIAIYCNPDHVHILIGLHPSISISTMAKLIKSNSSKWINSNNWIDRKFNWQQGYGAFSYSNSHLDRVVKYIKNQPHHHKTSSLKKEYTTFLKKYDIEYSEKYLFS